MRRALSRIMIVTIAAVSVSGCSLLDPSPDATIGGEPTGGIERTGKTLYEWNCQSCHGADGVSVTKDITDMKGWTATPTGTFGKFDTALTVGTGLMPKFDTLDHESRMMIYEYIKTF